MQQEKIKVTAAFIKDFESDKFRIVVPPRVIRKFPDKDLKDKKVLTAFIKKLPDTYVVIQRGHNYVIIPEKQFSNMNRTNDSLMNRTKKTTEGELVSKKTIKTIWESRDELVAVFPEIAEAFDAAKASIDSAGCTGCARRGRTNKLLGDVAELHVANPERKLDAELLNILGASFGRAVCRLKYKDTPYGTIAIPTSTTAHKLLEPIRHTHYTNGVRPSCLDCCRKHLGQAIVILQESDNPEYPNYFWLGLGHLAEVESESMSDYPFFAKQIRDIRLAMMAQRDYVPNLMELFDDLDILEFGEKEEDGKNTD